MHMNRFCTTAVALAFALAIASLAAAQPVKNELVGSWSLVSLKAGAAEPYGPNPHGIMFLGPNGQFSITIVRQGVVNFASNNRTTGTDQENKAAVQGSLAYFG